MTDKHHQASGGEREPGAEGSLDPSLHYATTLHTVGAYALTYASPHLGIASPSFGRIAMTYKSSNDHD